MTTTARSESDASVAMSLEAVMPGYGSDSETQIRSQLSSALIPLSMMDDRVAIRRETEWRIDASSAGVSLNVAVRVAIRRLSE